MIVRNKGYDSYNDRKDKIDPVGAISIVCCHAHQASRPGGEIFFRRNKSSHFNVSFRRFIIHTDVHMNVRVYNIFLDWSMDVPR